MKTAFEQYQDNPGERTQVQNRARLFNGIMAQLLAMSPLGEDPWEPYEVRYNQLVSQPQLFHFLIEGSHEHPIEGGRDIIEVWRYGRELIADTIRPKTGALRLLDVGSSNGLLLKTI